MSPPSEASTSRGAPALVDRLVVQALARLAARREPVDRVSKATLRAHPELDAAGRARTARALHGVRCFSRRLEWRLTEAGLPHTPALLWAEYRVDVLGEAPESVAAALDLPGCAPGLAHRPVWPEDPVERLATQASLPTWIAAEWHRRFGADARALAEALNVAGPITLRASRRAGGREALQTRLQGLGVATHPTRWSTDALRAAARFDIRANPAYLAGAFEVQDEGSQLIAAAVGAQPEERILDLCAGSGGKTLALADHMRDRGALFAADVDRARLADLEGRVRRRELTAVRVLPLPAALPADVDRALVDAPCSAVGTWRRGPDRRWRIHEAEIPAFTALQSRLLDQAAETVRPGGRLVYATCSLLEAENQTVADAFGARRRDFEPVPVLPGVFEEATQVELRPDVHGTDGFFIAGWRRQP